MTTPFTLTTAPDGTTVIVDGVDLSDDVSAVELTIAPGKPAHLVLHVPTTGTVSAEGVVTVVREPTDDELRERLASWLGELDAAAVYAAVRPRLTNMRDSYAMSLRSTRSEGGGLAYILKIQARVLERDSDDEETEPLELASLEVAYGALYTSNEEALEGVSDDEARAFGYTVALMTIWPFMRAIIANTIREMNLPGSLVLPMISQSDSADAAANDGYDDEEAEPE